MKKGLEGVGGWVRGERMEGDKENGKENGKGRREGLEECYQRVVENSKN